MTVTNCANRIIKLKAMTSTGNKSLIILPESLKIGSHTEYLFMDLGFIHSHLWCNLCCGQVVLLKQEISS